LFLLITVPFSLVMALTKQFNAISGWVMTVICSSERLTDRVNVLKKFIGLAKKLLKIGNVNSMLAIMSALDRGALFRYYVFLTLLFLLLLFLLFLLLFLFLFPLLFLPLPPRPPLGSKAPSRLLRIARNTRLSLL